MAEENRGVCRYVQRDLSYDDEQIVLFLRYESDSELGDPDAVNLAFAALLDILEDNEIDVRKYLDEILRQRIRH